VKVLEAIQLILSVPGAPILAFLAIDSRVVVASIEQTFGKVMLKAHISGWEYLDKIVQLPFSLPEVQSEKVERLMMKCLEGPGANPAAVASRIKLLTEKLVLLKLSVGREPHTRGSTPRARLEYPHGTHSIKLVYSFKGHEYILDADALITAADKGFSNASIVWEVAKVLTRDSFQQTRKILDPNERGMEEELEICGRHVNDAIEQLEATGKLYKVSKNNLPNPQEDSRIQMKDIRADPTESQTADAIAGDEDDWREFGGVKGVADAFMLRSLQRTLRESPTKPMATSLQMDVFKSLSGALESNPRALKRIVNSYMVCTYCMYG
jgi:hypothetical protein